MVKGKVIRKMGPADNKEETSPERSWCRSKKSDDNDYNRVSEMIH